MLGENLTSASDTGCVHVDVDPYVYHSQAGSTRAGSRE
jgi:hypothetical protein